MRKLLNVVTLLGSAGTLVCCVLPALFVTLGFGATFAALIGAVPGLVWFSENKPIVFGVAGLFIALSLVAQWRARYAACPADPKLAAACTETRAWSRRVLVVSLVLFTVGAVTAFTAW